MPIDAVMSREDTSLAVLGFADMALADMALADMGLADMAVIAAAAESGAAVTPAIRKIASSRETISERFTEPV